uniref:translation initiation factor IF-2 N-terminal domain-containing protein n=1 Tax=Paenibacillus gorillae TaxID=1243662 RepID=UPI0005A64E1F
MSNQQDGKDNKDKTRVYEYAKSLNMSSKEIITILKRLNLPVNNHMSVMENAMVQKVEGFFRDIKANAAAKRAQESSGATVSAASQTAGKPQSQPANKNISQDRQGPMNSIKTNTQPNQTQTTPTQPSQSQPSPAQQEQRPAAQSQQGSTNNRPAQGGGNRPSGGYQGNRPNGQGGQGGNRPSGGYQGNRPAGS